MLKLCLALPTFYPTFAGGPLRFLRYQPRLRQQGVHACVLAGTAREKASTPGDHERRWNESPIGTMLPPECIEGVQVRRVRLPDRTSVRRTSIYFRALIAHCQTPETRPDVIQIHSFERLEALFWIRRLRRLGIPLLYAIQIARPPESESLLRRSLEKRMLRDFYGLFDGVATSSECIRESLRDLGVGVPIEVIPNGVDLDRFHPTEERFRDRARRELGIQDRAPVVLAVGAVSPRKGTDLLVEAFEILARQRPDARLLVVGPRHDRQNPRLGGFEARIEQLVRRCPCPDRILFTGVRDDLPRFYTAADVVVMPTDREGGTPNVVLEAMACARPVLLTPFEGQSVALGRPGIEFEQVARSAAVLGASLIRLLGDRERRENLSRRGLDWVRQHLDVQHSVDHFADLYFRSAARTLSATAPRRAPIDPEHRLQSVAPTRAD